MFFRSKEKVTHLPLTLSDGTGLQVTLKRHAKARKMKLRVTRSGGEVTLTLPPKAPLKLAQQFLADSRDWIEMERRCAAPITPLVVGGSLLYQGQPYLITAEEGRQRGVKICAGHIYVPTTEPDLLPSRLRRALQASARKKIQESVDYYASVMNISYRKLSITDTKSRWGSCSSAGDLRFNFRLIMAPPALLDYVVVHELAHRVHMDHSRAFWDLVETYYPDCKQARRELKSMAAELQSYQF